jgi:hypothetical protein
MMRIFMKSVLDLRMKMNSDSDVEAFVSNRV